HGVLLQGPIFANGLAAPANYATLMPPPDATLLATGPAVNKGAALPNINDGFTDAASDLGALEVGCPQPIYGPRPVGIDESNEPLGCDGTGAPPSGTAAFLKTDITTQGSWKPVYGGEGVNV